MLMARVLHVDEIDHDEPCEVAQPKLARDLVRRLEIGLERRLLDVALARRAAGIDVDRDQRLGLADDDVAAGFEPHRRLVNGVDLALDGDALEQRNGIVVKLHAADVARHQRLHERLGRLVAFLAFDEDFVDVPGVEIADSPLDQIPFLVDQRRRGRFQRVFADFFPQPHQVLEIALDLGHAALHARGAQNDRHPVGHLKLVHDALETLAVGGAGDPARDSPAAVRVRHQDAVTSGERQIRRQRRALGAALFLDHLDQQHLPALDHFLDLVVARGAETTARLEIVDILATHRFDARLSGRSGYDDRLDIRGRLAGGGGLTAAKLAISGRLGGPYIAESRLRCHA